MGKNLIQQRRGKRNTRYLSPSHRFIGKPKYNMANGAQGTVKKIIHAAGRLGPLAIVEYQDKNELMIPSEGTRTGQKIVYCNPDQIGNIVQLKQVSEGMKIFNIELNPGDGGKLCRSPGCFATVVTSGENKCIIELPSRKQITLSSECKATLGIPSGYGRDEKPFVKAGRKFMLMHSRGKLYPKVRGTAMNAVDHPFGGRNLGKHKTVSRHAPPGRKVGSISPTRTGKTKK